MNPDGVEIKNPELLMLLGNLEDGENYRFRREPEWTESYTFYRDKVQYNRLTQRQSVNLPLMKTVLLTLLKDIDDMPNMYFENLDNDKQAELFKNEYWKYTGEENKFEVQDIIDKKQVFHFGRSFDQWQIIDGKVVMNIEAPDDMLIQRYCNPHDIHSSRFLIQQHIFKPITKLKENKDYDQDAVARIEKFYKSNLGLLREADNQASLERKNQKMADLGLSDVDAPVLGETYVELSLHFVYHKEQPDDEEEIWLYVVCDQMEILMKKKLEEIIGVTSDHFWRNHYPYNTWAGDIDRQDFWTDGIADTVRTPNKILNAWFSQMVENRTMRSFGMNYYNSSIEGYAPSTWVAQSWGQYGVPVPAGGKITDVITNMQIPDLGTDSLNEMNFILSMVERASGASATQQGAENQKQITLGEVQLALTQAKERIKGMSKFYTQVWKERGLMFIKMLEASSDKIDAVTIYKKGRNTDNIYSREIAPDDWKSKMGYRCRVWSQDEKDSENTNSIEKINASAPYFAGNPKFTEIQQRKLLEFDGLTPDETNDVMKIEQEKQLAMAASPMGMMGTAPGMPPQPGQGAPQPNIQAKPMIPSALAGAGGMAAH